MYIWLLPPSEVFIHTYILFPAWSTCCICPIVDIMILVQGPERKSPVLNVINFCIQDPFQCTSKHAKPQKIGSVSSTFLRPWISQVILLVLLQQIFIATYALTRPLRWCTSKLISLPMIQVRRGILVQSASKNSTGSMNWTNTNWKFMVSYRHRICWTVKGHNEMLSFHFQTKLERFVMSVVDPSPWDLFSMITRELCMTRSICSNANSAMQNLNVWKPPRIMSCYIPKCDPTAAPFVMRLSKSDLVQRPTRKLIMEERPGSKLTMDPTFKLFTRNW